MRKGFQAIDLTGERFGLLVVEGRTETPATASGKDRNAYWRCRCDCGGEKVTVTCNLRRGTTWHCGCKTLESRRKAGQARAQKLLNGEGKSKVKGYKTPGGDNDVGNEFCRQIKECKCPVCKRTFERLSVDWVYKRKVGGNTRWYCGYKCWRMAANKPAKKSGVCRAAEA